MSKNLNTFKPSEIVINDKEAKLILGYFFPREKSKIDNLSSVNHELKSFAQGLMLEGIHVTKQQNWLGVQIATAAIPLVKSVFLGLAAIPKIIQISDKLHAIHTSAEKANQPIKLTHDEIVNGKIAVDVAKAIGRNFGEEFGVKLNDQAETSSLKNQHKLAVIPLNIDSQDARYKEIHNIVLANNPNYPQLDTDKQSALIKEYIVNHNKQLFDIALTTAKQQNNTPDQSVTKSQTV